MDILIDKDIVERMKDGHLVSHYLLASYCYYQLDQSPMTDPAYDLLCVRLLERWDFIDDSVYPHKRLINHHTLNAGSGFDIPLEKYPKIIQTGASEYLRRIGSGELHRDIEPHLLPLRPTRIVRRTPQAVVATPTKPARILRTPPKGS